MITEKPSFTFCPSIIRCNKAPNCASCFQWHLQPPCAWTARSTCVESLVSMEFISETAAIRTDGLLFACLFICFKPYLNFKNHFLKNPVMFCSHIFYFVDFIAAPYCSGSHFWLANEGFIPAALMEFSCIIFILFCLFGFILFYLFKLFHGELVIGVFNFKKNLIISPI